MEHALGAAGLVGRHCCHALPGAAGEFIQREEYASRLVVRETSALEVLEKRSRHSALLVYDWISTDRCFHPQSASRPNVLSVRGLILLNVLDAHYNVLHLA